MKKRKWETIVLDIPSEAYTTGIRTGAAWAAIVDDKGKRIVGIENMTDIEKLRGKSHTPFSEYRETVKRYLSQYPGAKVVSGRVFKGRFYFKSSELKRAQ